MSRNARQNYCREYLLIKEQKSRVHANVFMQGEKKFGSTVAAFLQNFKTYEIRLSYGKIRLKVCRLVSLYGCTHFQAYILYTFKS